MKLLSHLNPVDIKMLSEIDDNWPFQFLPEYTRFHYHFFNDLIKIAYDSETNSFMPMRFFNMKILNSAQILFSPHSNAEDLSTEKQDIFFRNLINYLKETGTCDRLVQPFPYSILATHPPESQYCEFGTYIVELENQNEDQILSNFHPKYQKAITHSINNNAIVKIGKENLVDFYNIYESTMKHSNLHFDNIDYFRSIYDYLGEERVACGVVYDNEQPVSGIFLIYTKYGAFLTHAGTQGKSKLYGAAKLLNYEMMKYLKKQGVKRYDLVGVRLKNNNPNLEGIFRFKKGFGGELKSGYLWKTDISKFKAKAYDILTKFKTGHVKSADIIDQVNH